MNTVTPVALRHALHQTPELMFEEYETTRLIAEALEAVPGIVIHRPLETGLVVEYTVNSGEYLLFRADIDALPVQEETGVPFASRNNCMHACGHDVHTSILYGFLLSVIAGNIQQNMIFVFQPGEEGGGGAEKVINSGILNSFNVTKAFALHVTDDYPVGTLASTSGVLFASAVEIDIVIHGKSSHIAFPERGINALSALRTFLDKADAVIAGYNEPVLFGYGKVSAGVVRNIIPAEARADCTLRTLSVKKLRGITDKFTALLNDLAEQTGIQYELKINSPYTEVVVNPELFSLCSSALSKEFTVTDCGYRMTAEDFGLFSHKYPSFMFWLGTSTGEQYGLHTSKFLPGDEVIAKGIQAFTIILHSVTGK